MQSFFKHPWVSVVAAVLTVASASGPAQASLTESMDLDRAESAQPRREVISRVWSGMTYETFVVEKEAGDDAYISSTGSSVTMPAGSALEAIDEAEGDDGTRYMKVSINEDLEVWVREEAILETAFLLDGAQLAADIAFIQPVRGRITSRPSKRRRHPVTGRVRAHKGTDIAAPTGTPVKAAANGTVSYAGWMRGYGKIVIIQHPGRIETRYAHLSRIRVRVGQKVAQANVIGNVGSTGLSTGPHLHFEKNRR